MEAKQMETIYEIMRNEYESNKDDEQYKTAEQELRELFKDEE
jgi:hypothetical protein